MAVSEKDREYFRRVGGIKAASHAEATAEHLALSLGARLRRSWELYLAHRDERQGDAREDDPSGFYDRARALGLYRP